MDNKGKWNLFGLGIALMIIGVFFLARGTTQDTITGAILMGLGATLAFKEQ